QAIIWRAFASHGVGVNADSTTSIGQGTAGAPAAVVVEDFTVPDGVTQAEQLGPLPAPSFTLSNAIANAVTVTINGGVPVQGASQYTVARATAAAGPFVTVATLSANQVTYTDTNNNEGLSKGQTF